MIQDTSNHLEALAILFTMSDISGISQHPEAVQLVYYGKERLQRTRSGTPSTEEQFSSHEGRNSIDEERVINVSGQSQLKRSFDRSQWVVALVPGQALDCGVRPNGLALEDVDDGFIYPSTKDVLRWKKLSEWIDNYDRQNPTKTIVRDYIGDRNYSKALYNALQEVLKIRTSSGPLIAHAPNFPGNWSLSLDRASWFVAIILITFLPVFLMLLVVLPLVYGGVHLTTWNFGFSSKIEHLLWKIACIDIMGTIPFGLILDQCLYHLFIRSAKGSLTASLTTTLSWVLFIPLFLFYALSRIYIVVESFISLRHVPIGVYAAIPWVQDMPHG